MAEGGAKQPGVLEDITEEISEINIFREESTLNSLWYDDKNAQWKTEVSDDDANRLNVIIRPQL